MDDQRSERGICTLPGPTNAANSPAIWLGHLWMQSFLGRWLVRTNTPTDQLQVTPPGPATREKRELTVKKHMGKLEPRLPFPDLCRVLSLQFPFPGCGDTAREDLYLFLGTAYESYPMDQMDRIHRILGLYLHQMPDPLAAPPPDRSAPSDIAQYTSLLKEKGDTEGVVPEHVETMLQETPPVWRATATYGGLTGTAEGKSKKEARHRASKEVYALLTNR